MPLSPLVSPKLCLQPKGLTRLRRQQWGQYSWVLSAYPWWRRTNPYHLGTKWGSNWVEVWEDHGRWNDKIINAGKFDKGIRENQCPKRCLFPILHKFPKKKNLFSPSSPVVHAIPSPQQHHGSYRSGVELRHAKTKRRMVMPETIFLGMIFIFCSSLSVKRSARSPSTKNIWWPSCDMLNDRLDGGRYTNGIT